MIDIGLVLPMYSQLRIQYLLYGNTFGQHKNSHNSKLIDIVSLLSIREGALLWQEL